MLTTGSANSGWKAFIAGAGEEEQEVVFNLSQGQKLCFMAVVLKCRQTKIVNGPGECSTTKSGCKAAKTQRLASEWDLVWDQHYNT